MTYEKMQAEVIIFDNSDVLTASGCSKSNSKGTNCGHKTSGNSCNQNGTKQFDQCLSLNHAACPSDLGK